MKIYISIEVGIILFYGVEIFIDKVLVFNNKWVFYFFFRE